MTVFEGKRISELPAAAAALGTMELPVNAAGAPQKLTVGQVLASAQPLDADLTAIAALTTTAYGRAFLAMAGASDLTALTSGTAFPTGAALTAYGDDRPFFRTDLGESYYHHGANWLSTTLYEAESATQGRGTAAGGTQYIFNFPIRESILVQGWAVTANVGTTNNTGNFYWVRLLRDSDAYELDAYSTGSASPGAWVMTPRAVSLQLSASNFFVDIVLGVTGVPGAITLGAVVAFRKIAT